MNLEESARSFRQFQLACTGVKSGLFRHLADSPKTCDSLAAAMQLPAERLVRVLRGLVWAGLLGIDENARYTLNDQSRALLDDSPGGAGTGIRFQAELFYRAWAGLPDFLANGVTPFESEHGQSIFELLQADPKLAELYGAPMARRSTEYSAALAQHPAIAGARTIVDVGGGHGQLLVDILGALPHASGIIFDLEAMRASAEQAIESANLVSRCRFEGGDFFRAIPTGADVYILKWIIHDWNDEAAIAILRTCAGAMTPASKLLIVERLMPENPIEAARSGLVQADLNMLCQSGGAERSPAQYQKLCEAAGLRLVSSTQVEQSYGFHALECRR